MENGHGWIAFPVTLIDIEWSRGCQSKKEWELATFGSSLLNKNLVVRNYRKIIKANKINLSMFFSIANSLTKELMTEIIILYLLDENYMKES